MLHGLGETLFYEGLKAVSVNRIGEEGKHLKIKITCFKINTKKYLLLLIV